MCGNPGRGERAGTGRRRALLAWRWLALCALLACAAEPERSLEVTASAYNSLPAQTLGNPRRAAWGDMLKPGVRAIAVSRDLVALGLVRGARVRIEGLPGEYVVLDKMARRWRRRIDIYMGDDVEGARAWGVRKVHIHWRPSAVR